MSAARFTLILNAGALLAGCQTTAVAPPATAPAAAPAPAPSAAPAPAPARAPAPAPASPAPAPGPATVTAPTAPAQDTHWTGSFGGRTSFGVEVVGDAAGWAALWQQLGQDPPRPLDLARQMAVVVFLGERRTGGHAVRIGGVSERDGKLVVSWRELVPGPDMMVSQAITAPWAVALVPRSNLPVVAERENPGGAATR